MSCSHDSDRDGLWFGLAIVETFGEHPQGERFSFCHSLVSGSSIGENASKLRDFREPATIFFAFVLNREIHVPPRQFLAFYACSNLVTQREVGCRNAALQVTGLRIFLSSFYKIKALRQVWHKKYLLFGWCDEQPRFRN